jgi:hypothetical protein
LGHRNSELIKMSDHDLKTLMLRNNVPIMRRRKEPEPEQKREAARPPEPDRLPEPARPQVSVRMFDFMKRPAQNFQAALDVLHTAPRDRPLAPTAWSLPPQRNDSAQRVEALTEQLAAARNQYDVLCVALGGMEQDSDFSRKDLDEFRHWMLRKKQDVALCETALLEELRACRQSLDRREVVDPQLLDLGVIDQTVFESWSHRQLGMRRQLNELEVTLGAAPSS